jgi:hypothetical protein
MFLNRPGRMGAMQQSYNFPPKTPKPHATAAGPQPHGKPPAAISPNSRYWVMSSKADDMLELLL